MKPFYQSPASVTDHHAQSAIAMIMVILWVVKMTAILYYKIAQSVFLCPLSPPKRLYVRRRNLACRRMTMLSYTWAGSFVDRGHRWEDN